MIHVVAVGGVDWQTVRCVYSFDCHGHSVNGGLGVVIGEDEEYVRLFCRARDCGDANGRNRDKEKEPEDNGREFHGGGVKVGENV